MGWFDQLLHFKYRTRTNGGDREETLSHKPWFHLKDIWNNLKAWSQEQRGEYQHLSEEREEANNTLEELKTRTGMAKEQRNAEISRITKEMPGPTEILRSHPIVQGVWKVASSPFKFGWHALRGTAKGAAVIAPRITPSSNTSLLFLAFVYHFAFVFFFDPTLITRIYLNIVMILLIIVLIFDSSERNGDNYRILILIAAFFEILLPYLTTFAVLQEFDFVRLYLANSLIIWTWVYYAVFVRGKDINYGLTKWMRRFIIIFWLGVLLSFIGTSLADFDDIELDTAGAEQWYAAKKIFSKAGEGWELLWQGVVSGFGNMQAIFSMRMKQATGEYYYGVVEENEKEPLGVYLENIEASQNEYEEYEPVTVYATLSSRTLDDAVYINVGCYAGQEKNKIRGTVYPDDTFSIDNLQQEELDCSFEQLPEGTNKITYNVSFNFQTVGYLKRYFADRDAITAATRNGIDLLDEYQITDKEPVAHYTNGPVNLGMGPESALIGVSETYTVKPRLALTLDSGHGWGGMITALEEVVLFIPDAITLDTTQCTDSNWKPYTVDACVESELKYDTALSKQCNDDSCIEEQCTNQLTGYNAYTLAVDKDAYKNIENFITISCRLNVNDPATLLGAMPIATHYFFVKTRYTYQISDDISVNVVEREDVFQSTVSGEDVTTASKDKVVPTFSAGEEDEALQYIFYHYNNGLFTAADASGVSSCTQASIIAQTSGGDSRYYNDGRIGLFGLTQSLIVQAAAGLGLGDEYSSYKYDAATNIRMGAWQLQQLKESDISALALAYYNKIYGLLTDTEEVEYYATKVANYYRICEELGLTDSKKNEQQNANALIADGSVSYDYGALNEQSPQHVTLASSADKELRIVFVQTAHTVATAYLYYDATKLIDTIGLSSSSSSRWATFDRYPAQIFFDTTKTEIRYRYLAPFVVNTGQLLEDTTTALVENVLYVTYDSDLLGGALVFSFASDPNNPDDIDDFCTIEWHPDIAYGTCANNGLPGLIVRNLLTENIFIGTDYAKVQIEWDPTKQMEELS